MVQRECLSSHLPKQGPHGSFFGLTQVQCPSWDKWLRQRDEVCKLFRPGSCVHHPHSHPWPRMRKENRVQLPEQEGQILGRQNVADSNARRIRCTVSSNLSKMCINLTVQLWHGILGNPGGQEESFKRFHGAPSQTFLPSEHNPVSVSLSFPLHSFAFWKDPQS